MGYAGPGKFWQICPSCLKKPAAAMPRKEMARLSGCELEAGGVQSHGARRSGEPCDGCIGAIGMELKRGKQSSLLQETEPGTAESRGLCFRQRKGQDRACHLPSQGG